MRSRAAQAWLLWSVLVAQAVLTLPWLWRTAPFTDEALYLSAGHQEWSHWLHHTALPDYVASFSGAPVLYPPIGAVADSLGGLAAARGLSLIFMLGATTCVYLCGSSLFGRRAAFFAAALFAVSGLIIHNGAFATYSPLAIFLLSLATFAAVKASDGSYGWVGACAAALALANATKYATLAWDPVIIGITVTHGWRGGTAEALRRSSSLAATLTILDVGLMGVGGAGYLRGVLVTTVARTIHFGASSPPSAILWHAITITGIIVFAAAVGVFVSASGRGPLAQTALLLLLTLGALIAPLDQAHLRQLGSLDKNMGFGLIFAALAAGYACSGVIDWAGEHAPTGRVLGSAAGCVFILGVLITGRLQTVQFRGPSSTVAAQLVAAIGHGYKRGTYILSDGAARMEQYYLPGIPSHVWMGIFNPPRVVQAKYRSRICSGQISLVILRLAHGLYDHPYDYRVQRLLNHTGRYQLAVTTGQGNYSTQVWQLRSGSRKETC